MEAKEHIYNLRTNLQEVGSFLSRATDQHIMFMLDKARAVLASQRLDREINVIQMTQTADFKTREATKEEIGQLGTSNILAIDIPVPVSHQGGSGIFSIGPTNGSFNYTEISYSQLQTVTSGRKYTSVGPKWLLIGSTVYLLNIKTTGTKLVRVRGVWDEPYKIVQVQGLYKYLSPFSWEYPLTNKDVKAVYQIALSGDLGWSDRAASVIAEQNRKQEQQN